MLIIIPFISNNPDLKNAPDTNIPSIPETPPEAPAVNTSGWMNTDMIFPINPDPKNVARYVRPPKF